MFLNRKIHDYFFRPSTYQQTTPPQEAFYSTYLHTLKKGFFLLPKKQQNITPPPRGPNIPRPSLSADDSRYPPHPSSSTRRGLWVEEPQFDIPRSTMFLIYSQTLVWTGAYFSPLLSLVGSVKLVIMFYVRKVRQRREGCGGVVGGRGGMVRFLVRKTGWQEG